VRALDLAQRLGVRTETVRRWMIRLDRWPFPGSGGFPKRQGVQLTDDDVRAVTVAIRVADYDDREAPQSASTTRAINAANCTIENPWASHILATPDWASAHESAASMIAVWYARDTPVAAFVDVEAVMAPITSPAPEATEGNVAS